ncbi:leucyl aminopeptidase [Aurantimicrobium minutum]|uniref:leucyl aminopeptidase n=1 Tax=Aurantimicrobium minutum TaxID=708131 RepID=UPI0024744926|nr:leucyl aminopeptidase [Aurantimicrobium minutum]MDH6533045.1 leucyl aminopeptidase [Aurantimicrobium minutum]
MTIPQLSISVVAPSDSVLVVGARSVKKQIELISSEDLSALHPVVTALDVSGATDALTKITDPTNPARIIAVVGLGSDPLTPAILRNAAASAVRRLQGNPSVAIDLNAHSSEETLAIAEGALLGTYSFDSYKSTPSPKTSITEITVISGNLDGTIVDRARVVAEALSLVKDLVNTPPNDMYPASFVEHAEAAVKGLPLAVTVWDEKKLAKDGFGGIVGVGQGSSRPPRMMKLEYSPTGATTFIALVGKGITFDTGGLSLKSGAGMIGMKYDMTGAASTLAIIRAAAQLGLGVKITAWLCLAENMPSSTAIRPNDVLTIRGGKTVEVLNTDAEGRLVLADGLTAASEEYPDIIIDMATLTGAATTALGTRYTGAMGDAQIISQLMELGTSAGEQFWHMPLPDELRAYLNSDVADIANVKPGNTAAGMLVGATFLKDFIGKTSDEEDAPQIPWVHLDIANTANNAGAAYGVTGAGPTGVAVRTLLNLAETYASA